MSESVDDLTIQYEEEGQIVVKQIKKHVLTKGAWATLMFLYQDLDRKTGEYGKEKISIRRYRKMQDKYRQQSKFNISSPEQAKAICATIQEWTAE